MKNDHEGQTEGEQSSRFERCKDVVLELGAIVVDGFLDLF
jgi:hypothetical protein